MSEIKNQLSKEYRALRSRMNFQLRERESEMAISRLMKLPEWITVEHVMLYVASGEELDTVPLVKELLSSGAKKLYVPYIESKEEGIRVSSLIDYSHLAPGTYGILEPRPPYRVSVDLSVIDVIIVPGIVFDRRGGRIGFGHGYYDRFLKTTGASKIALAYEFQLLQEIPQSAHDVPMDVIVTASDVVRTDNYR